MVREVCILPEMLVAGVEAWEEGVGQSLESRVVSVYLAMRAIEEICEMRRASETVH